MTSSFKYRPLGYFALACGDGGYGTVPSKGLRKEWRGKACFVLDMTSRCTWMQIYDNPCLTVAIIQSSDLGSTKVPLSYLGGAAKENDRFYNIGGHIAIQDTRINMVKLENQGAWIMLNSCPSTVERSLTTNGEAVIGCDWPVSFLAKPHPWNPAFSLKFGQPPWGSATTSRICMEINMLVTEKHLQWNPQDALPKHLINGSGKPILWGKDLPKSTAHRLEPPHNRGPQEMPRCLPRDNNQPGSKAEPEVEIMPDEHSEVFCLTGPLQPLMINDEPTSL